MTTPLPPGRSSSGFLEATATTVIYTLSLHDALPILFGQGEPLPARASGEGRGGGRVRGDGWGARIRGAGLKRRRSEEHTSELQSHVNLVCRLLLEKKNELYHIH